MKPTYLMTRKERRAAAQASASPTTPAQSPEPVPAPKEKEISAAQLAANRQNAQQSSGPKTEAGKRKISQNALKTGLTGAQILLPTDDAALYEATLNDYKNQFAPVGPEETHLLQSIVDARWRLARIPGLESALIDLGRRRMLEIEPGLAGNPAPIIEMQVRLFMAKELRNLHLQENRLVSRREREMKEFRALQATRQAAAAETEAQTKAQQAAAAKQHRPNRQMGLFLHPPKSPSSWPPSPPKPAQSSSHKSPIRANLAKPPHNPRPTVVNPVPLLPRRKVFEAVGPQVFDNRIVSPGVRPHHVYNTLFFPLTLLLRADET